METHSLVLVTEQLQVFREEARCVSVRGFCIGDMSVAFADGSDVTSGRKRGARGRRLQGRWPEQQGQRSCVTWHGKPAGRAGLGGRSDARLWTQVTCESLRQPGADAGKMKPESG